MHAGDGNSRPLHLVAKRLCEAADRELGGIVGRLARHGDEAEQARHIDDMAGALRPELRQEGLGPVDHAPEVDLHHPFEIVIGEFVDARDLCHAGIVYDDVGTAMRGFDVLCKGIDRIAVRDIEKIGRDPAAQRLDPLRGFGKAAPVEI